MGNNYYYWLAKPLISYGEKASEVILEIINKQTVTIAVQAEKEITKLGEKYYLSKKPVEPVIFLQLLTIG